MVRPQRAAVRPRVVSPETGDSLILEDAVRSLIDSNVREPVEILGARGAGKTTALEHLAATLGPADRLVLLDEPDAIDVESRAPDCLIVYTSCQHRSLLTDTSLALAPWSDDDVIEYLLAEHPTQCRSVMGRLQRDSFRRAVSGHPRLWRLILDEMAQDETLPGIRDAIRRGIGRWLSDPNIRRLVLDFCFATLMGQDDIAAERFQELASTDAPQPLLLLIFHHAVRLLCAADRLVAMLPHAHETEIPSPPLLHDLIREVGQVARSDSPTVERLRDLLDEGVPKTHPFAASVLHAAGAEWRPRAEMHLVGAYLSGVPWGGVDLSQSDLSKARLDTADLTLANLHRANLYHCSLVQASLGGARCVSAQFANANLNGADILKAIAESASFCHAQLAEAVLNDSLLVKVDFRHANLRGASFRGADLSQTILTGARIDDADFTNANLHGAVLNGLTLRNAVIGNTRFSEARLRNCDLEFLELTCGNFEGADLSGSWLTGTVMPGANFRNAKLCSAGLADIEWPGADLRGADLQGCSFHMGSSRCGLVDSPYPSHGSRTGFYTDTYDERYYKPPEAIRKANLTGADLRGANVQDTDFYLVDLRKAIYDPAQADHFLRCNAILHNPIQEE